MMADQKKKTALTAFDDTTFQALEKEFQQTLDELLGDQSVEKFRVEYKKLYKALTKTHESEKRLMRKCRELNAEIVTNSAKMTESLKMSQKDQETILSLKKEVQKAWNLLDVAQEKETKSRDTIHSLRQETVNLSKLVEKGVGLLPGQESSLNELLKIKEMLTKERDSHLLEISGLREQFSEATTKLTQLQQEKADAEDKILKLTKDVQERTNRTQKEVRKRDKLERELKQTLADLDARTSETKSLTDHLETTKTRLQAQDRLLKDEKTASELLMRDAEVLTTRCDKLKVDLEEQLRLVDVMVTENQIRAAEIKQKEDELYVLKSETQKLNRLTETMQRKLRQVEEQKADVETERDTLRSQVTALEREMEAAKKQAAMDKNAVDDLARERDVLKKNMKKAKGATESQVQLVKLHERSQGALQQEIAGHKQEAGKQRNIIYQLEVERDRYINEASSLTQKVLSHMEELKVREMHLFDLKKKLAEADTKLKQQQNLYEAVRSDRNLYSKNLIECQDEITENKRKMNLLSHQLSQLKEEIQEKEASLLKEQLEHRAVEKEKASFKVEVQRIKHQIAESQTYMEAQKSETEKLLQVIAQADALRAREKKEIDQVISERDILGTQLVRRNDELSLLYEKIRLQESLLERGERQYNQRMQDFRLLRLEVKNLRRQNAILRNTTAKLHELQQETINTESQLLREQARCKALEEEMENPMNIHRWRTLEGTDPPTHALLWKTHALQKRLIKKTEEVVEKEILIQEKEKLYLELRNLLTRQPGPEVAEQMLIYQATLRNKTKQLKALTSELNMNEADVSHYKHQLETMARELHQMKQKYFLVKKREQQARETSRSLDQTGTPSIQSLKGGDLSRFTGGGFKLVPGKTAAQPSSSKNSVVIKL